MELIAFYLILPAVITLIFLVACLLLRNPMLRILCGMLGVVPLVFILYFSSIGAYAYIWALHLEAKWLAERPDTQEEMEALISLYSRYDIDPAISDWGSGHELKEGERMTRYMILWDAPLDVVYTNDDQVVAIYTSYE